MDGIEGTLRQLMRKLPKEVKNTEKKGTIEYYFSGVKADEIEEKLIQEYLRQLDRVEI